MKVVIDTNVVASGIFFGGNPQRLLQYAIKKDFDVFVSDEIVAEYTEIIQRLAEKYPDRPQRLPLEPFISSCKFVSPKRKVTACRDPDDNKFIECALESKCLYVVSGDDDLLSVKNYEGIEIITTAEFLHRLNLS